MRLLDSDILSYALYDESPAHPYAWKVVRKGLIGEYELYVTQTTILETYNVLYWFYRVRPSRKLIEKLKLTINGLKTVKTSDNGLNISLSDNIPLGDGFLIATAMENNIPIIVSNDKHIVKKAPKYGLTVENPIPKQVKDKMAEYTGS